MLDELCKIKPGHSKRQSSYDVTGRNADYWAIEPGETRVLADIQGPGKITHIWMTQDRHYREALIKITWDNAPSPSILVPLGDFFCLGHGIVNSFQSVLFEASTAGNNQWNTGCALNCYAPMPFKERAVVELINESNELHKPQYFHGDYELYDDPAQLEGLWYFQAEFHREKPFGGWGMEIPVNYPEADISNMEETAWQNNYVILETQGRGHYVGCNLSITNFQGTWWGEGDDMIWVDGYHWPPDLHGTGSEDYLNQAWGMQDNAHLRNGSSILERNTGGYQTSYVFHVENPVRFEHEIKVTIEHGHGNHLRNEVSSVAYWYATEPTAVKNPPPLAQRMPVRKDIKGWIFEESNQITSREIEPNPEMLLMKKRRKAKNFPEYIKAEGPLTRDEAGIICLQVKFSAENPELYPVPLAELLEAFAGKMVRAIIAPSLEEASAATPITGVFDVTGEGVPTVQAMSGAIDLAPPLEEFIGQNVAVEILQILPEDQDADNPADFEITIVGRVTPKPAFF